MSVTPDTPHVCCTAPIFGPPVEEGWGSGLDGGALMGPLPFVVECGETCVPVHFCTLTPDMISDKPVCNMCEIPPTSTSPPSWRRFSCLSLSS
ncbi:unnamed protein product, partial [Staurois parvus]